MVSLFPTSGRLHGGVEGVLGSSLALLHPFGAFVSPVLHCLLPVLLITHRGAQPAPRVFPLGPVIMLQEPHPAPQPLVCPRSGGTACDEVESWVPLGEGPGRSFPENGSMLHPGPGGVPVDAHRGEAIELYP